jgi:DNA modification methylase
MKRYGKLDLRNMDCMDLLRDTADNAYDLAIVDPPYGIGNFNQSDSKYNNKAMTSRVKRETHSKCISKQPEIEPPPQGGLLF